MLDILMDVVKLSSFPPVTTARVGHKKGFEESGSSSWTKEPRAASPPGAAGPWHHPRLFGISSELGQSWACTWSAESSPAPGCKEKGSVHQLSKPKSTFNDQIMAAEVQVSGAAAGVRYKVLQRNQNCSKEDFLACSTLLSALSLQTARNI